MYIERKKVWHRYNMSKLWGHHVKGNEPSRKCQTLFESTWSVEKCQIHRDRGETVAAWGWGGVLVRVSIPVQTSWPRSKLGRKGFIRLTLPYCCSSLKEVRTGTQAGQEAGADAEAMEGCYLLACFPWLVQLSYRARDYQPRDGTTHHGPCPLDH